MIERRQSTQTVTYQPLTDDEWVVVEPLVGPRRPALAVRAPPVCGLNPVLHVFTTKCLWVHLPQNLGYPPHITARCNFKRWQ
ncbi:transposase [Paraburkholderia sabiae]|uniref:Transposase n=1 Tax=Paraburkholderia sabiae TaxID=273251 RepID=A0ABU9QSC1_9BURK|nr:transposase [Paraburkholderia sabiae]CAD6563244.1 hypothetical protein LMG24235_08486 [Paraburkholderia sabiae]